MKVEISAKSEFDRKVHVKKERTHFFFLRHAPPLPIPLEKNHQKSVFFIEQQIFIGRQKPLM